MELAIKCAALGLVAAVCIVLIKKHSPEQAFLLGIAAAVAICAATVTALQTIWDIWESIASEAGLSAAVMGPVAKCVALGLITRLCADLCKDSGSSSIASAIELTGSVSALLVASPLMSMLLELLGGLV